ncbi:type II toxin-antitoxin system VapC family toxin [Candidatus Woesearchaeota archaeon]|nr:type II toxin-antitoxin system VapC family toxin [Candidatus Woesearchaeota archaeon]
MKLLDTDIFIDFFRGVPEAEEYIAENIDEIVFSAISEAELLSGKICNDQTEREKVFHLLSQFDKIPVGNPLVQIAGDIRRNHNISLPDAIIAASAAVNSATLVTRNLKHFKGIDKLKVEDPY